MGRKPSVTAYRATRLLGEVAIAAPPVDPWGVLERLKERGHRIDLLEQPQDGFEGCTIKVGNRATIILNANAGYLPRKKFTLSHEIGHAWIESHQGTNRCHARDIESPTTPGQETEANQFASELLMPHEWFLKDMGYAPPGFDLIRSLSNDRYGTSLTATALKFVDLSDDPCALVLSEDGRAKWVWRSERWTGFVPTGFPLDFRTVASRYFRDEVLPDGPVEVVVGAWISDDRRRCRDALLLEEAVALPNVEQVLSILQPLGEDGDEEEDERRW